MITSATDSPTMTGKPTMPSTFADAPSTRRKGSVLRAIALSVLLLASPRLARNDELASGISASGSANVPAGRTSE